MRKLCIWFCTLHYQVHTGDVASGVDERDNFFFPLFFVRVKSGSFLGQKNRRITSKINSFTLTRNSSPWISDLYVYCYDTRMYVAMLSSLRCIQKFGQAWHHLLTY